MKGTVELRGRSILVAGEVTELGRFLADRFRVAGADVFLGPPAKLDRVLLRDRRLDAVLVLLTHPDPVRGPFALVEAVQQIAARQERYPRYAIGFCEGATGRDDDGVALALATTLCRYLSAHTVTDDVRVNVVSAPLSRGPAIWESAADVGLALTSGLLDAMRGQVLEIPGGVA